MTGAGGWGEGSVVIDTVIAGRVLPLTGLPGCAGARPAGKRRGHGRAQAPLPSPDGPARPFPGTSA